MFARLFAKLAKRIIPTASIAVISNLINVNKTKVMASDGIACRILIQNELLEQVDTFPYLGYLVTEDGECTTEFLSLIHI